MHTLHKGAWAVNFSLDQWVGNVLSLGAIVGTVMGWLPAVAAVVALIWYVIQIVESKTFQRWYSRRRARKIKRLQEQVKMLQMRDAEKLHDALELKDVHHRHRQAPTETGETG